MLLSNLLRNVLFFKIVPNIVFNILYGFRRKLGVGVCKYFFNGLGDRDFLDGLRDHLEFQGTFGVTKLFYKNNLSIFTIGSEYAAIFLLVIGRFEDSEHFLGKIFVITRRIVLIVPVKIFILFLILFLFALIFVALKILRIVINFVFFKFILLFIGFKFILSI